jgi:hypothetical protein
MRQRHKKIMEQRTPVVSGSHLSVFGQAGGNFK